MNNRLVVTLLIGLFIISSLHPTLKGAAELTETKILKPLDNEEFDLLIISPLFFSSSLNKLAQHKETLGIKTEIVTLRDIYNGKYFAVQGSDKAEQIKYFIKNSIEKWNISYVLLVGGDRQIPVRYVHNFAIYPTETAILEPPYISDLYYADIYDSENNFSTWDSNKNGIYGEWIGEKAEDKDIDLRPDVSLGRLPCKNVFEVRIMVRKIINYETKSFNKSWFKNMVVVGGDTYIRNDDCYEGEVDTQEAIDYMDGFNHVKLWASNGNLSEKGAFDIIKSVNKGCGFLYLAGHGNNPFWATHKPNDSEWYSKFSRYHMLLLTNRQMLPICIVNGCRNSAFDTRLINLLKHPYEAFHWMDCLHNCWTWSLTHKFTGGSIATIGSTGLGHVKWDNDTGGKADGWSFLSPQFFWEYGVNNTDILGKVWGNVITRYLKKFPIDWDTPSLSCNVTGPKPDVINARSVQQFCLFGDPTLKIGGYKN